MRVLFGTHWMVACALALGACAIDDTPVDNTSTDKTPTVDSSTVSASTSAEASADTSDLTIPEELSFENLPDVTTSGEGGLDHSCHVRITSCGKKHYYPHYCSYGDCKKEPRYEAIKACYDSCGHHADCDKLKYDGKCDHGHDHGDEMAPDTSQI